MAEVGLYRVSGSASDVAKLKKSFESNSYEAEQLLKEVKYIYNHNILIFLLYFFFFNAFYFSIIIKKPIK